MSDDDSEPFDLLYAEAKRLKKMVTKMQESQRVGNELKAISQQIDEEEKRAQEKIEKIKKEMDEFKESYGRI